MSAPTLIEKPKTPEEWKLKSSQLAAQYNDAADVLYESLKNPTGPAAVLNVDQCAALDAAWRKKRALETHLRDLSFP